MTNVTSKKSKEVEVIVYENDARVHISSGETKKIETARKRGKVNGLSKSAMKRMKLTARNVQQHMVAEVGLTYPREYPHDGRKVERDRRTFTKRLARQGIGLIWVKEFQTEREKHGFGCAPHMHAMVTKFIQPHKLAKTWYEVVGSQDERHLRAGTHIQWIRNKKRMGSYFVKYMTKTEQKTVPADYIDAGRMWGYTWKLLDKVQINFNTSSRAAWNFIRYFRRWNAAQIREWYKKKWKRRNTQAGFMAWNGRNFIEAYRARFQNSPIAA